MLVGGILGILLTGLLAGLIRLMDFALLTGSVLIFFAAFLTATRKDPFTRVPTALELEKMKRKMRGGKGGNRHRDL